MRSPPSFRAAATVAAAVAVLPFARGLLAGRALYFRDLSIIFHPFRRYALEGLSHGHVWFWDPYVHEGVPLLYLALSYPVDVLQLLWPDERGISAVLALHVPLAAVTFVLLARTLGVSPRAAAGGAVVYALGGFTLSMVNLYVYVQAMAWAPLVVATLCQTPHRDGRVLSLAALATAVTFSTMAVEVAGQAVLIGLALTLDRKQWRSLGRPIAAVALGAALAAPVFLVMKGNMVEGDRARGFAVDVVLNQSIHPFTLAQTLVANLYGDLSRLPDSWWGSNFFDRGFPYVLSLYLGATVLALALVGALGGRRARIWIVLAGLGLLVALGRWGGLGVILDAAPASWRVVRFPTKAFFTVQLAIAVLASLGLDALGRGRERWRSLAIALAGLALPLVLLPLWPALAPDRAAWFLAHFFPPALSGPTRASHFAEILEDGAFGGAIASAAAAVAFLAHRARVQPAAGAVMVAALAATDLLRAGAGLNPMLATTWFEASPEIVAAVRALGVRRAFTCDVESSRAYWEARRLRPGDHEMMTFGASRDTLTPHTNRPLHVETALSADLTSLVPVSRLMPTDVSCADPARLLPWLRGAGVSHVVSLDPMEATGLRLAAAVAPARIAPLRVLFYAVEDPLPLRFVARSVRRGPRPSGAMSSSSPPEAVRIDDAPEDVDGAAGSVRSLSEDPQHLRFEVESDRPTALVVLDGSFPGWTATVNGAAVPVLHAESHRAVWVAAGRSRVELSYRPHGLRSGLLLSALACAILAGLWQGPARKGSGPYRETGVTGPMTPREENTPRQNSGS